MSNLILITIIPDLMLTTIPNASLVLAYNTYAGGPRLDYDEAYADVQGAPLI
jgi:hypothetical protein